MEYFINVYCKNHPGRTLVKAARPESQFMQSVSVLVPPCEQCLIEYSEMVIKTEESFNKFIEEQK